MHSRINAILWMFLVALITMILFNLHGGLPKRHAPIHKGVPQELQPLVNEYKVLAARRGIYFDRPVTIGFVKIKSEGTIGVTYVGSSFREIDIDSEFWGRASEEGRKALLYHELTHAYCDRDHDYGPMRYYPPPNKILRISNGPGYLDDGCPLSVMHPIVLDDWCMSIHYNRYVYEMFDRCLVW